MKKLKGLQFSDTKKGFPTQDHYCLAYHDPNSITWSWLVWWTPPWRLKNRTIKLNIVKRVFGTFHVSKQEKMFKSTSPS